MRLADFTFDLPDELIARYPAKTRSSSRLMCVGEPNQHHQFADVLDLLNPGDLLVFNDTRVIPARLHGQKTSGGQVEVLIERVLDTHTVLAQLRVSKSPRAGDVLLFNGFVQLVVTNRYNQFFELKYEGESGILDVIESIGQVPLPPYIKRKPEESDKERYQTVYAKHDGSVAAPTAGLHFDQELLLRLEQKQVNFGYLTLHIGAGTFSPVRVENVKEHKMHPEYLEIDATLCEQIKTAKAYGHRVVSVGTTSLRALETASQSGAIEPYEGETSIFIYPGYHFNCADSLITNLHLPGSTLLMLVCAFAGQKRTLAAYQEAVKKGYRFYSYGDAMWLNRL